MALNAMGFLSGGILFSGFSYPLKTKNVKFSKIGETFLIIIGVLEEDCNLEG